MLVDPMLGMLMFQPLTSGTKKKIGKKWLLHTIMSSIQISKLRPQPFDIKIILFSLRCNEGMKVMHVVFT